MRLREFEKLTTFTGKSSDVQMPTEINDEELDKRINVYLMWKIMSDRHLNKFTLHTILQNLESPKKSEILKEISQFMALENN